MRRHMLVNPNNAFSLDLLEKAQVLREELLQISNYIRDVENWAKTKTALCWPFQYMGCPGYYNGTFTIKIDIGDLDKGSEILSDMPIPPTEIDIDKETMDGEVLVFHMSRNIPFSMTKEEVRVLVMQHHLWNYYSQMKQIMVDRPLKQMEEIKEGKLGRDEIRKLQGLSEVSCVGIRLISKVENTLRNMGGVDFGQFLENYFSLVVRLSETISSIGSKAFDLEEEFLLFDEFCSGEWFQRNQIVPYLIKYVGYMISNDVRFGQSVVTVTLGQAVSTHSEALEQWNKEKEIEKNEAFDKIAFGLTTNKENPVIRGVHELKVLGFSIKDYPSEDVTRVEELVRNSLLYSSGDPEFEWRGFELELALKIGRTEGRAFYTIDDMKHHIKWMRNRYGFTYEIAVQSLLTEYCMLLEQELRGKVREPDSSVNREYRLQRTDDYSGIVLRYYVKHGNDDSNFGKQVAKCLYEPNFLLENDLAHIIILFEDKNGYAMKDEA